MIRVGGEDSGLYLLAGGAITAFLTFLAPIIAKWSNRPGELRQDRRVDFDTMLAAANKLLDQAQEEAAACRTEAQAARADRGAMQATIDTLRRQLQQANETLARWASEFNRPPVQFDEKEG